MLSGRKPLAVWSEATTLMDWPRSLEELEERLIALSGSKMKGEPDHAASPKLQERDKGKRARCS